MKIPIIVDSRLHLQADNVPASVIVGIQEALSFKNAAKEMAEKEQFWGWQDLPDTIDLWEMDDRGVLHMPRGFANTLRKGLERKGHEPVWEDNRFVDQRPGIMGGFTPANLRPYQEEAAIAMVRTTQGIYKAPPGSGKTVTALEMARRCDQPALVIVNKLEIAEQWQERAKQHIGAEMGLVGDGVMDVRELTVAMQQTLWSRRDELEQAGFFRQFGFVLLDECHHLPARTFTDILQRFDAHYRYGVSATPDLNDDAFPIILATLGPVVHETPKDLLRRMGVLKVPTVKIVKTGFTRKFFPTHNNDPKSPKGCEWQKICTRSKGQRLHRNNYDNIISALVKDPMRASVVAIEAWERYKAGGTVLVLSKRLAHLAELRDLAVGCGCPPEDAIMFTGEQDMEERGAIRRRADQGKVILFSTIADEALDIPHLDTVVLAFPGRNTKIVEQQVGRVERPHPDKLDPLIVDFEDEVSVMKGQLNDRMAMYMLEGLHVSDRQGVLQTVN